MGLPDFIDGLTGKDDQNIRTNERALLVLSELSDDRYSLLYSFLESSGVALALSLSLQYRKITVLTGQNAESHDFVGALRSLAAEKDVQKIDVFSFIHGNPNKMYFSNGEKSSDSISAEIAKLDIGRKLRMYLTTACYGATHAEDMIRAGFNCASGSRGVNANAAVMLPECLALWASGSSFKTCIDESQNRSLSKPFEDKAEQMGFSGVDSTQVLYGNGSITITTNA